MIIDSHAHINLGELSRDTDGVADRARKADTYFINIGTDLKTSQESIVIATQYPQCAGATVGLHPHDSMRSSFEVTQYRALLDLPHVIGIGEVGLDFYRIEPHDEESKKKQETILRAFIGLARAYDLPVVFHVRGHVTAPFEPYDRLADILSDEEFFRGVLHCYGGNLQWAQAFGQQGMYIGITGIVTFDNAKNIQDVTMTIPLSQLLVETDCPFLAPAPHRGETNEPAYVVHVAEKVAELRGMAVSEVITTTNANVQTLFPRLLIQP